MATGVTYRAVPDTVQGERLRERLAAFLTANGIDASRVPVNANVIVEGGHILTEQVQVGPDGRIIGDHGTVVTRPVQVPLTVPMDELPAER